MPSIEEKQRHCVLTGLDFKVLVEVCNKELDVAQTLLNENRMDPMQYSNTSWSEGERSLALKLVIAGAFYPNYFLSTRKSESDVRREAGDVDPYASCAFGGFSFVDRPSQYADQVSVALQFLLAR